MTTLIIFLTVIIAFAGVSVALWSLINTRNKYFEEFKERKKND